MKDQNKYNTNTPFMIPGSSEPLRHYMVQGSSEPLRYPSYAEEQLEHAVRRAEDEGKKVSVLQGDKDMGSAQVERYETILHGMRRMPLERRECIDEEGSDFKMEPAKELHIEALVNDELDRIVKEHGLFNSEHEAWAVIMEESEEAQEDMDIVYRSLRFWWEMIRDDDTDNLDLIDEIEKYAIEAIKELVQVIACCRKYKRKHLRDWVQKRVERVGGNHDAD